MDKNTQMEKIRHSLAHLLAMAVIEKFPKVKLGIGPVIENGFYYDFDFGKNKPTDADLAEIEKKVRGFVNQDLKFKKEIITPLQAKKIFANQPYKLELIDEIKKSKKPVSIYTTSASVKSQSSKVNSGSIFVDLCAGPHIKSTKEISADAFKLTKLAGAYWKGDEKNSMLTRIYGLAFENKKELDAYLKMMAEAEKRDHRKIGTELDLFTFSPLVGSGLPLWTPKGTIIREELNNYVWELRSEKGYQRVAIPHITKKDLYETSGHWAKFSEELFKIHTREGKTFCMKPMNCPHHTQIYAHLPRSYKDLPQRYAETTMVYRDEQSGELSGLTRVISITQDDAHVFCRSSQIKDEFYAIWEIIDRFYKTFDFKLKVRLSFHDPKQMNKYLGTPQLWKKAEAEIKEIAAKMNADYFIGIGEAAMYGPKLDFMATDAIGREHQVATIQLDMNLPERFDLSCVNEEGKKERIVMIHCAIMGSIERFSAVLIEHLAGHFPLWLSPIQVKIINIGEKQEKYANEIYQQMKEKGIRAEFIIENETLGKKIRAAEMQKIPYVVVIGDKEMQNKTINVRHYKRGQDGEISVSDLMEKIKTEIKEKK